MVIRVLIITVLMTSCTRNVPVGCLTFVTPNVSIPKMIDSFSNSNSGFEIENRNWSLTERQKSEGEQWLVVRKADIKVAFISDRRSGNSYVCVYNYDVDNMDKLREAEQAYGFLRDYLDGLGVGYRRTEAGREIDSGEIGSKQENEIDSGQVTNESQVRSFSTGPEPSSATYLAG